VRAREPLTFGIPETAGMLLGLAFILPLFYLMQAGISLAVVGFVASGIGLLRPGGNRWAGVLGIILAAAMFGVILSRQVAWERSFEADMKRISAGF
jgi:hypothetical protein